MKGAPKLFNDGPLHIDFERRVVTVDAVPLALSTHEYNLLEALVRHRGDIVPYEQVATLGWNEPDLPTPKIAKYACVRLHRKLGLEDDDLWGGAIRHQPGVGYRYGRWPFRTPSGT